eukprot:12406919-Karenia_brevis.AAC.1
MSTIKKLHMQLNMYESRLNNIKETGMDMNANGEEILLTPGVIQDMLQDIAGKLDLAFEVISASVCDLECIHDRSYAARSWKAPRLTSKLLRGRLELQARAQIEAWSAVTVCAADCR